MRVKSVPAPCPPPPPVQVGAGAGRRGNRHISPRCSFGSQEVHFNLEVVVTDLLSTAASPPSIAALLFLDRRRQKLHLEGRNLNYVRDWVFALREGVLKERYKLETLLYTIHIYPVCPLLQADLLELPALSKKVKTESDEELFSSTENLLQLELDPIPEKG